MKENVLDVLMYLFQNAMEEEIEIDPDRETVQMELLAAGFPAPKIDQALNWLDSLLDRPASPLPANPNSCRIYAAAELERLDVECRGFLLRLEQGGILTPQTRAVFLLRLDRHLSYRDIAGRLNISEAAVYKHIAQATRKLQEHFKTHDNGQ